MEGSGMKEEEKTLSDKIRDILESHLIEEHRSFIPEYDIESIVSEIHLLIVDNFS